MNDAMEQLGRAYDCWRKWHNPMSRRWLRECIMEYRLGKYVSEIEMCLNAGMTIQEICSTH